MPRILTAAMFLMLSAPSLAQNATVPSSEETTEQQRRGPGAAFAAMDKDGNGTIEKAEWLAAGRREQGFALLDADRDGKLTKDELRAGIAKLRARRGQ